MEENQNHFCWICLTTVEESKNDEWVKPCACRGSIEWVHSNCLLRWIDEKRKENSSSLADVQCPHCRTKYVIDEPEIEFFLEIYERSEKFLNRYSEYAAISALVGSSYVSTVFSGSMTILQIYGGERGLEIIKNANVFILMMCLPSIPCSLMIIRTVQWRVLLRNLVYSFKNFTRPEILLSRVFLPPQIEDENGNSQTNIKFSRKICEVAIFPLISSAVGCLFGNYVDGSLQKTLLGGFIVITLESACKLYYENKKLNQPKRGKIADYTEWEYEKLFVNILNKCQWAINWKFETKFFQKKGFLFNLLLVHFYIPKPHLIKNTFTKA